jgi:hypothetical protein
MMSNPSFSKNFGKLDEAKENSQAYLKISRFPSKLSLILFLNLEFSNELILLGFGKNMLGFSLQACTGEDLVPVKSKADGLADWLGMDMGMPKGPILPPDDIKPSKRYIFTISRLWTSLLLIS